MRTDETFEGRTRIKKSKNKQEKASSFVGHEHDYVLPLLWVSFLLLSLMFNTNKSLKLFYICLYRIEKPALEYYWLVVRFLNCQVKRPIA